MNKTVFRVGLIATALVVAALLYAILVAMVESERQRHSLPGSGEIGVDSENRVMVVTRPLTQGDLSSEPGAIDARKVGADVLPSRSNLPGDRCPEDRRWGMGSRGLAVVGTGWDRITQVAGPLDRHPRVARALPLSTTDRTPL